MTLKPADKKEKKADRPPVKNGLKGCEPLPPDEVKVRVKCRMDRDGSISVEDTEITSRIPSPENRPTPWDLVISDVMDPLEFEEGYELRYRGQGKKAAVIDAGCDGLVIGKHIELPVGSETTLLHLRDESPLTNEVTELIMTREEYLRYVDEWGDNSTIVSEIKVKVHSADGQGMKASITVDDRAAGSRFPCQP